MHGRLRARAVVASMNVGSRKRFRLRTRRRERRSDVGHARCPLWWLARETKGLLIGESANREIVAGITRLAQDHSGIERVNEVLTMHMGPNYILAGVNVDADCNLPRARAQQLSDAIDRAIRDTYPNVKRVFVEARCEETPVREEA
jgi:divalent metal cation (Fe/Co/Zn/Cd) transporter